MLVLISKVKTYGFINPMCTNGNLVLKVDLKYKCISVPHGGMWKEGFLK